MVRKFLEDDNDHYVPFFGGPGEGQLVRKFLEDEDKQTE